MASMTDVIFLLLIFFLVTSTIIVPNTIKVTLPTSAPQSAPETPSARVTLTPDLHYYLSIDRGTPTELTRDQLKEQLGIFAAEHPEAFVSVQADETRALQGGPSTVINARCSGFPQGSPWRRVLRASQSNKPHATDRSRRPTPWSRRRPGDCGLPRPLPPPTLGPQAQQ